MKPLIDTTAMFATMKWEFPGPNEVAGGATALSDRGFNYPEAHQKGTRRMKARPWSGLRPENRVEIERDTFDAAQRALTRARGSR